MRGDKVEVQRLGVAALQILSSVRLFNAMQYLCQLQSSLPEQPPRNALQCKAPPCDDASSPISPGSPCKLHPLCNAEGVAVQCDVRSSKGMLIAGGRSKEIMARVNELLALH